MNTTKAALPDDRFHLNPDRPVRGRKEDLLGRAAFAEWIARQVATAETGTGFAIGLLGPWGSGKTSILNMMAEALRERPEHDVVLLHFNPWLFSGAEQLVAHFFRELGAQLLEQPDERLRQLGDTLADFGSLLSPLVFIPGAGPVIAGVGGFLRVGGGLIGRRSKKPTPSLVAQRAELHKELQALRKRVVVIVDDIDRLRGDEIPEVMRLVKLTADLPNTVFVLAFDRTRVEEALSETEGSGRAYLEKLLQVTYDVPVARELDVARLLLTELMRMTEQHPHGPFDERTWTNVFNMAVRRLFRSVRDVRRYLNALPVTLEVIGEEVALADVRALLPDVFAKLIEAAEALTDLAPDRPVLRRVGQGTPEQNKEQVLALVQAAGQDADGIRELCRQVFPASARYLNGPAYGADFEKRWWQDRRVANQDILRIYLETGVPKGALAPSAVDQLFTALANGEELHRLFSRLDPETLEYALARLQYYADDFRPEWAEASLPVLLDLAPRLREDSRHFWDFGAETQLVRVILPLLWAIPDEAARAEVIRAGLRGVTSLSAQYLLVGRLHYKRPHDKRNGQRLVSAADADPIEKDLRQRIITAPPSILARERDLFRIVHWVVSADDVSGRPWAMQLLDSDTLVLALLTSALNESREQGEGEVAVRRQYELPWGALDATFDPQVLRARVRALVGRLDRTALTPREAAAVAAADAGLEADGVVESSHVAAEGSPDER